MHEFYRRMEGVFERAGSNRRAFCRKHHLSYPALQACWNSDKLPQGNVLEAIAREYHVSLDAMVLGTGLPEAREENPTVERITRFLREQDEPSLLRIDGALQMFRYLMLAGGSRGAEAGAADTPAGAPGLPGRAEPDIIPAKILKASELLADLSRLVRKSTMAEGDRQAARGLLGQVISAIYERELKDEWAELEEVD